MWLTNHRNVIAPLLAILIVCAVILTNQIQSLTAQSQPNQTNSPKSPGPFLHSGWGLWMRLFSEGHELTNSSTYLGVVPVTLFSWLYQEWIKRQYVKLFGKVLRSPDIVTIAYMLYNVTHFKNHTMYAPFCVRSWDYMHMHIQFVQLCIPALCAVSIHNPLMTCPYSLSGITIS